MKKQVSYHFKHKRLFSDLAILVILLYAVLFFIIYQKKDNNWKHIINSDGKGYYLYLPAAFIYQDFTYSFLVNLDYDATITFNYDNGHKVNRYFCGTALLMAPFFFTGILFSWLFNFPIDGYSLPFQVAIYFSTFLYAFIGFLFLRKLFEKYHLHDKATALTILFFFLATNIINYSLLEPAFSHVYSFSFIVLFCYYAKCLSENHDNKILIKLCLVIGIIFLTRPINAFIIFSLPFFFKNVKLFIFYLVNHIFKNKKTIICILIIFGLFSIQLLMYYFQTGKFLVYAYDDAHLNLKNPHIKDVLWGYTKGMFIYTPITFLSLGGFPFLFKQNKFQAIYLFIFLYCVVYLVSSWSSWTYGHSFGMRAMIEYYPFFALLFVFMLQGANNLAKLAILVVSFAFALLNHIQNYQYVRLIIDGQSATSFRYWRVFLRTNPVLFDKWKINFLEEFTQKPNAMRKSFTNDFDAGIDWGHLKTYCQQPVYSGKNAVRIIEPLIYSPGLSFLYADASLGDPIYISVSGQGLIPDLNCFPELMISIENETGIYFLHALPLFFHLKEINKWSPIRCGVNLPFPSNSNKDVVKVYFMNNSKSPFYLDDLKIEIIPVVNK